MVRRALLAFFLSLRRALNYPLTVFWICLSVAFLNVLFDGSLVRLWSLRRDLRETEARVIQLKAQSSDLRHKIQRAMDPAFVEKEARERFDMAEEGDLVFVFSEDN